jgi:hypothetical protein
MLVVGDRVKIIDYPEKKYVGKKGEVFNIGGGVKIVSQPVVEKLPRLETEVRYDIRLDNGKELYGVRERQIQTLCLLKQLKDWELTEWGKKLIKQLSCVRVGQRDRGRVENVSGYLVHFVIGDQWHHLSQYKQHALASESRPKLRKSYEGYLQRGYRTEEAAKIAINEELQRLIKRYLK